MDIATSAILFLWVGIFVYAILGSIDFGSSFWAMYYSGEENSQAGMLANKYLSPTWEVTNVFLVLLAVTLYSFFPYGAFTLGTVLLIPASLILVLLALRSAFMVFAYTSKEYSRALTITSGLTGVLIPGLFMTVPVVTLGGFIDVTEQGEVLLMAELFTNPITYAFLLFGVASELFISALFLANYSRRAEDMDSYRLYRRNAIVLGPIALTLAMLTVLTLNPGGAEWLLTNMREEWGLATLSIIAFLIGYGLLFVRNKGEKGRPQFAIWMIIAQYFLAAMAFGRAHMPYFIYPTLTIEQGLTNNSMFRALMVSNIVGILILVPIFIAFWYLFISDKRYVGQSD